MSESLAIESNLTLNFTPLDSCSATEVLEYSPLDKLVPFEASYRVNRTLFKSTGLDPVGVLAATTEHKQQWDASQAGGGAEKDRHTRTVLCTFPLDSRIKSMGR